MGEGRSAATVILDVLLNAFVSFIQLTANRAEGLFLLLPMRVRLLQHLEFVPNSFIFGEKSAAFTFEAL